ncbi:hypothetical protein M413DRAFT_149674 [Hebeloma cylindrosporum]|uniref:Uncharacterized protein n=1 Tax=Hebeloma cylindrosporum TaxID=76867 RepID=A0A0C3CBA9_HEBCY|nr:hypothetical protein M413DRAFT_149674 [Hebeloma cylindrosporum h7]
MTDIYRGSLPTSFHIFHGHILGMKFELKPEFAALLRNNDIPSELTILEVTESLKGPLHALQEVEAEIQRLTELMETMEIRRQRIREVINDHKVILSPVRRLPPDVLHEIFFHCMPTDRNPVMKHSESPLLLTRICSSWRAIALSSPRIWSKIYIPLPGNPIYSSNYGVITDESTVSKRRQKFARVLRLRCDAVRKWLSRSEDDELPHEMFSIVLSFADRWRDIDLSMPHVIYNELQSNINATTFSSLRSLKVTLSVINRGGDTQFPQIRLLAAPSLRRIVISAEALRPGNVAEWNHITHITLTSSITSKHLLRLLRQCPNLVFGNFMTAFMLSQSEDQTVMDEDDVFLPRLETLVLYDSGTHEAMTIAYNAIKAPALTRFLYKWFKYRVHPFSGISFPPPVILLLGNSALISDLSLVGDFSTQDIRECLQRAGRITRVVFGRPPPTNTSGHHPFPPIFEDTDVVYPDQFDLRMLLIGSEPVTLLPRLEYLEIYCLSSLTDEDLLDVIKSRINAFQRGEAAALKCLKLNFQRRRQKDIKEDVIRLAREAGIEVKLDLTYQPEICEFIDRLSPSFGINASSEDVGSGWMVDE